MRTEWRKKVYDVLRGPIHPMDGETFTELDEIAADELDLLEPIIDSILAEQRRELRELMVCGHLTIHLEQEHDRFVCRMCEVEELLGGKDGDILPRVN
jgi:hypothetical protein